MVEFITREWYNSTAQLRAENADGDVDLQISSGFCFARLAGRRAFGVI
jgi:hypothetical protein